MLSLGNGVSCSVNGGRVLFDPSRKARDGLVCISHGHSDHARQHTATTLMTPATKAITGLGGEEIDYGQEKYGITAHNAGHVLGSAQFSAGDIAYTGDFLMDSPLLGGAKPLECDDLVIEATFGLPEFVFPKREEVIAEIGKWVSTNYAANRTVVLGGYPLGKAQELTKIVSDLGIQPVIHPQIARINRIYEEHGVRLGRWVEAPPEHGAFVAVMPFNQVKQPLLDAVARQSGTKVVAALATGWAMRNGLGCKAFPLSDHADFPALIDYVEQAHPKRVHTVHGFSAEFARQLQRRGWRAAPLRPQQRTLAHW